MSGGSQTRQVRGYGLPLSDAARASSLTGSHTTRTGPPRLRQAAPTPAGSVTATWASCSTSRSPRSHPRPAACSRWQQPGSRPADPWWMAGGRPSPRDRPRSPRRCGRAAPRASPPGPKAGAQCGHRTAFDHRSTDHHQAAADDHTAGDHDDAEGDADHAAGNPDYGRLGTQLRSGLPGRLSPRRDRGLRLRRRVRERPQLCERPDPGVGPRPVRPGPRRRRRGLRGVSSLASRRMPAARCESPRRVDSAVRRLHRLRVDRRRLS
jgi:hypothetical protein